MKVNNAPRQLLRTLTHIRTATEKKLYKLIHVKQTSVFIHSHNDCEMRKKGTLHAVFSSLAEKNNYSFSNSNELCRVQTFEKVRLLLAISHSGQGLRSPECQRFKGPPDSKDPLSPLQTSALKQRTHTELMLSLRCPVALLLYLIK